MESQSQECSTRSSTRAPDLDAVTRARPSPERAGAAGPHAAGTVQEARDGRMLARLAKTIEQEIIPRLMLAHRAPPPEPAPEAWGGQPIAPPEVQRFARLVLSDQEDLALAEIHAYRARQVPIETLYLDLLAPTARYLGELWNEDLCNFTDVTVGLGRLQRVLRELSPSFGRGVEHPGDGRRVLLLPSPGEQHTFGLVMVSEFFRRAGWNVTGGSWAAADDAASLVADEWFDVVGFSLGAEVHLPALGDAIRAARHATCNPDLLVLVGGPVFGLHPEYVGLVGADAMTIDGRQAPVLAEQMIASADRARPRAQARQPVGGLHR